MYINRNRQLTTRAHFYTYRHGPGEHRRVARAEVAQFVQQQVHRSAQRQHAICVLFCTNYNKKDKPRRCPTGGLHPEVVYPYLSKSTTDDTRTSLYSHTHVLYETANATCHSHRIRIILSLAQVVSQRPLQL